MSLINTFTRAGPSVLHNIREGASMIPLLIQDAIDQNHKNPADKITRRLTVSHEAGHLLSCIALGKEITDYDVNRRPHLATLSGMTSTLSARVKKLLNIEEISANLGFVLYKCTNTIDDLLIISSGPAGTLLLGYDQARIGFTDADHRFSQSPAFTYVYDCDPGLENLYECLQHTTFKENIKLHQPPIKGDANKAYVYINKIAEKMGLGDVSLANFYKIFGILVDSIMTVMRRRLPLFYAAEDLFENPEKSDHEGLLDYFNRLSGAQANISAMRQELLAIDVQGIVTQIVSPASRGSTNHPLRLSRENFT